MWFQACVSFKKVSLYFLRISYMRTVFPPFPFSPGPLHFLPCIPSSHSSWWPLLQSLCYTYLNVCAYVYRKCMKVVEWSLCEEEVKGRGERGGRGWGRDYYFGVTRLLGVLGMWSPDHSAPQLLAWAACFPPSISEPWLLPHLASSFTMWSPDLMHTPTRKPTTGLSCSQKAIPAASGVLGLQSRLWAK